MTQPARSLALQRNTPPPKVGSIGAHWPPALDARNARVKGFSPFKIDSEGHLRTFRSAIADAEAEHPEATRTTVRAFMTPEIRRQLQAELTDHTTTGVVEVHFPVDNVFPGYELVYVGHNAESRMPAAGILEEEIRSVEDIMRTIEVVSEVAAMQRLRRSGYRTSRLTDCNERQLDQLLALYTEAYEDYTFDITPQTIGDMLDNGNLVLVGVHEKADIVSAMIAEHAELTVDGTTVHLYELSDYATLRAHRRHGLITAMQIAAINSIRALEHGGEAIIYAEDRAPWTAVNISSQKAGMQYAGTAIKHCRFVADRDIAEQGGLENLNVWVALPSDLHVRD